MTGISVNQKKYRDSHDISVQSLAYQKPNLPRGGKKL